MTGIPNDALPPGATLAQWERYDQGSEPTREDVDDDGIYREACRQPDKKYKKKEKSMERKAGLWGSEDDEYLHCTDKNEAISEILDDCGDPLPETLKICGYARMEISTATFSPLESIIEGLDEEYGDPDGCFTEPTEAMKEAEKVFLSVIEKEYKPWACEIVITETIDVQKWIAEHRPGWMEKRSNPCPT